MRITLTKIDLTLARPTGNIAAPGYRVWFTSSLAIGSAIFVPADTASADLEGASIEVEVNQEKIEEFRVLPTGSCCTPRITSISPDSDYEIVGQIANILVRGDDPRLGFITVIAGDSFFTIDSAEIGASYPQENDWVKFVARDLSLWDEAI